MMKEGRQVVQPESSFVLVALSTARVGLRVIAEAAAAAVEALNKREA